MMGSFLCGFCQFVYIFQSCAFCNVGGEAGVGEWAPERYFLGNTVRVLMFKACLYFKFFKN